jgi:hypothetical protein
VDALDRLLRCLRRLRVQVRDCEDALNAQPPRVWVAVAHLRAAEIELHDCRRQLTEIVHRIESE